MLDKTKNLLNFIDKVTKPFNPTYSKEDVKESIDISDPEEINIILETKEEEVVCDDLQKLIDYLNQVSITRTINTIFFHCTATNQNASISAIEKYWKETLKWNNPGYHIIFKPDGSWTLLQDFNRVANGVAGFNSTSLQFSYIGGVDSKGRTVNNMTEKQENSFKEVYKILSKRLPNAKFRGHNEVSNKACPSFDVQSWLKTI
jgi:N-acetylmuramoyl-L-alanine amidase